MARSAWSADLASTAGSVVVTKLRGLVSVFVIGAAYGLDAIGAVAFLYAAQSVLLLLAVPGLHFLIVTETPDEADARRSHLSATCSIGLGLASMLATAWIMVVSLVDAEIVKVIGTGPFALFGLSIVGMAAEFLGKNYQRHRQRIKLFALYPAGRMVAEIASITWWAVADHSLSSLISWLTAIHLLAGGLILVMMFVEEPPVWPQRREMVSIIYRALPLGGGQLASDVMARGDRILLAPLVSASQLGVYAASYSVASLTYAAAPALTAVVYPRLGARFTTARQSTLDRLDDFRFGFLGITTASAAALAILAPHLSTLLRLEEGIDVSVVFVLASAGILYADSQMTILPLVWSLNRRAVWGSQTAGAVLSLALLPVATIGFGLVGAGLATLAGYLAMDVLAARSTSPGRYGVTQLTGMVVLSAVTMTGIAIAVGPRGGAAAGAIACALAVAAFMERQTVRHD